VLIISSHSSVVDISATLLRRWAEPISPLPQLGDLAAYIEGPLEDDNKIPISHDIMNDLLSLQEPRSMCTPNEVQQLFRSSEDEKAGYILTIVSAALNFFPPASDSTENAFIVFWDMNIRNIVDAVITGRPIRDSNEMRSTALMRPDFGFLINGICAFRGEEKAPVFTGRHPKTELFEKLTWTYDPAPYILGQCFRATCPRPLTDIHSLSLSRYWSQRDACGYFATLGA
jgi:hypothetical protein